MENFEEIQDQIKQIVSKVEGPIYIFIARAPRAFLSESPVRYISCTNI